MYKSLAGYYNKFTEDIDYAAIANFAHGQFLKSEFFRSQKNPIVADIACGTGSLTIEMLKKGYDMIGVDISPQMLDIAKSSIQDKEVLWLCQDMKRIDLYGTVAGMICSTDSINHILYKNEIEGFFKRVYNFLEYSGVFIFDVLTERYFRDIVGNNSYFESDNEESCIWTSSYSPKRRRISYDITLYKAINASEGIYRRSDDFIEERAWTEEELASSIAKAGLKIKNIYSSLEKKKRLN